MNKAYRVGEVVVFAKQKYSTSPGPRAKNVMGNDKGESYSYIVDKFWRIVETDSDQITLKTRRGKLQTINVDDRRLRRLTLLERLFMRSRFPSENDASEAPDSGHSASAAS